MVSVLQFTYAIKIFLIFFIFLTSIASFQKWHYIKGLVLSLALSRLVMTGSTSWTLKMDGISGPFYTWSTHKSSSQKAIKSNNTNYYCLEKDKFDHMLDFPWTEYADNTLIQSYKIIFLITTTSCGKSWALISLWDLSKKQMWY